MYYVCGGLGGQYHGAKVQKKRLLNTLHHGNGVTFIFSSQKPFTILYLFTKFVYFMASFSTVAVSPLVAVCLLLLHGGQCLGGVPRSPVPRWPPLHICGQLIGSRTQARPRARRRVFFLIRFKKKKKNSLDGTNLPNQTKKTSRTFTPKALHPNRTNG